MTVAMLAFCAVPPASARVARHRASIRHTRLAAVPVRFPQLGARNVADAGGDSHGMALTFDDGPDPRWTPEVLATLEAHDVHATFFLVGRQAARYPDLVRQIIADGNAVGVHTWDHQRLVPAGEAKFEAQVDREMSLLQQLTGATPTCLRPPYGSADDATLQRASERHLRVVQWNDDPRDWTRPGTSAIIHRVNATPNTVVLLHDGGGDRSETVEALGPILDKITAASVPLETLCHPEAAGS